MSKQSVMLSLTDRAMEVLNSSASQRKRGEFVSKLIEVYADSGTQSTCNDSQGILERIEARLITIEKKVGMEKRSS